MEMLIFMSGVGLLFGWMFYFWSDKIGAHRKGYSSALAAIWLLFGLVMVAVGYVLMVESL